MGVWIRDCVDEFGFQACKDARGGEEVVCCDGEGPCRGECAGADDSEGFICDARDGFFGVWDVMALEEFVEERWVRERLEGGFRLGFHLDDLLLNGL